MSAGRHGPDSNRSGPSSADNDGDFAARVGEWFHEVVVSLINAKGEWEVQFIIPEGAHLQVSGPWEISAASESTMQVRPARRRRILPEETGEYSVDDAQPDESHRQDNQHRHEASS